MEKPVIISIRGVQSLEPGEEDVMELVTQGVLRQEEGEGFSLSYLESELTGLEGTTTTFRIAPDRITLRREGTLNSEMIFQEGQKHVSLYETPYGGLMLGVNTHRAKEARVIPESIYLMNHVKAPAVLVECGFLSNPEEAARLRQADYQMTLAVTIAASYLQWAAEEGAL